MHPTDPKLIRAYGDREGDGSVQILSRSVPPSAARAKPRKQFAEAHGLREPLVTTMEEAARLLATSSCTAAPTTRRLRRHRGARGEGTGVLGYKEIDHRVNEKLGRKIVVVGACTG